MESGTKILIVEDNSILSLVLKQMIDKMNYKCAGIASSQKESIRLALEKEPDLILMDVNLFSGNGIEAARKIKKELNIPILFISGSSTLDDFASLESESWLFLSKPFLFDDLKEKIERLLQS